MLKSVKIISMGVMALMITWAATSWGAEKKAKKSTVINFEDELIQGQVQKPELLYLLQQKQFNFKRLIKLRKNFQPEMQQTGEDLPDSGGGS